MEINLQKKINVMKSYLLCTAIKQSIIGKVFLATVFKKHLVYTLASGSPGTEACGYIFVPDLFALKMIPLSLYHYCRQKLVAAVDEKLHTVPDVDLGSQP